MVRLIMGVKGSGKTKQLIELINNAAKDEPGNVVCIEANRNMTSITISGLSTRRNLN